MILGLKNRRTIRRHDFPRSFAFPLRNETPLLLSLPFLTSVSLVHKQEEREQWNLDKLTSHPQKACNDPTGRENNCAIVRLLIPIAQAKLSLAAGFRSQTVKRAEQQKSRLGSRVPRPRAHATPPFLEIRSICRVPPLRAASRSRKPLYELWLFVHSLKRKLLHRSTLQIAKPLFPRLMNEGFPCRHYLFSRLLKIIKRIRKIGRNCIAE